MNDKQAQFGAASPVAGEADYDMSVRSAGRICNNWSRPSTGPTWWYRYGRPWNGSSWASSAWSSWAKSRKERAAFSMPLLGEPELLPTASGRRHFHCLQVALRSRKEVQGLLLARRRFRQITPTGVAPGRSGRDVRHRDRQPRQPPPRRLHRCRAAAPAPQGRGSC